LESFALKSSFGQLDTSFGDFEGASDRQIELGKFKNLRNDFNQTSFCEVLASFYLKIEIFDPANFHL
jgi:hypothetical protein